MNIACILLLAAALPLRAAGWEDDHKWKLDEKETIRRTFDTGAAGRKLLVDNVDGYVHVTGYSGSQVQVTIEKRLYAESAETMAEAKRAVKMDFSQQGNFVRLYEDGPFRNSDGGTNYRGDRYYGYRVAFDIDVLVPSDTELIVKTMNQGDIAVRKTTGDYQINGLNGGIEMEDIAGAGTVHTLNGKVKVSYNRNPTKPSEYKTLNGSVDIYFQGDLNADLTFKKLNGGIYTDFEVAALPAKMAAVENRNGKFVYRSGGGRMSGRAGKGGPALSFDTLNGNIRLHTAPN